MRFSLESLRSLQPEADYQALMAQMPGQSHPRRKLKELQNKGYLIRVKKGFYVFTKEFIGQDYSSEIVANLLHGPSYLSMEFALSYYKLIPERVDTFTSVTSQKNKVFKTPVGTFSYRHLSSTLYPFGVTLKKTGTGRFFLIASPEKALVDIFTLKFEKSEQPNKRDILLALEDDLRVNLKDLKTQIEISNLRLMREAYRNRSWPKLLINFLMEDL